MSGINSVFETARRALNAQRLAMNVTANNISNANTPGYSRQRVDFTPTPSLRYGEAIIGTGVSVDHVARYRSRFIDQQVRTSNDVLNAATTKEQLLSQVESIFNEPSDEGLTSAMTRFFNSFQELSLHPEDATARTNVVHQAEQLTDTFHRMDKDLIDLRNNILADIQGKMAVVNTFSKEISDLERDISNQKTAGADPIDLMDLRDAKIEELSKIAQISVTIDSSGSTMVAMAGVVIAGRSGAVDLALTTIDDQLALTIANQVRDVRISSGEMGASLELYNTSIPSYQERLDGIADTLSTKVNELHSAGYGMGTPLPSGNDFFTGSTAREINVNTLLKANPSFIAASKDGSTGNNETALAIADIANEKTMSGDSQSVLEYYSSMVAEIGSTVASAANTVQTQELVMSQLESQRSAVSGVSLDEEMTNLLKFQRSFDAASRVITTVDEMYQTILNMV